ncbi:MAG: DUF3999 domain-containing protein, partial [Desulfobacteraceae bacterium]|nr:DUF3999 domain-containing protein [Desulfobacteraceae bacterium]
MSRTITTFVMLVVFACAGFGEALANLSPEEFAFGLPLETGEGGAIFEVSLPLDFYRGVTRGDLSDMCVFNRAREVVPFAVRRPVPETPAPPGRSLPVFPVPGEAGRTPDGLSLRVHRDDAGTIVQLDDPPRSSSAPGTVAYLLDASSLKRPVRGLVLEWNPAAQGFVGRVSVEGSDDLEHWATVGSSSVVASLRYGEHSLVRNRILVNAAANKYLRISWPAALQQVQLLRAEAELSEPAAEPPRSRLAVSAAENRDRPGEYLFQSPGPLPVDRLRVVLLQQNTLASAELFSREDEKSTWKRRAAGLIYGLRLEGTDVVSPDLAMAPVTDRFWMLRVRQSGGGLGQGVPTLELGWVPQSLLFVARGEGPFLLAYGHAGRQFVNVRVDDLLAEFSNSRGDKVPFRLATAGAQVVLGGVEKLKAPLVDAKRAALWCVLILGVAVLAWMSARLFRQM